MRFSSNSRHHIWLVQAILLTLAVPWPTQAACYVCDEVVELNDELAGCLVASFDQHLTRVRQSNEKYSTVDLTDCIGSDGSENRGIVKMPVPGATIEAPDDESTALRTVYIMDEASLVCLRKLIDPLKGKLSPVKLFDLTKECAR